MRIFGIDYGEKRIGIATSDPNQTVALPVGIIENNQSWKKSLRQLIEDYEPSLFVLGLPKNLEGGDSKKAEHVRAFAGELEKMFNLPCKFWDERYSTKAVKQAMILSNVKQKKGKKSSLDAHAATFFLQGYLDANKG